MKIYMISLFHRATINNSEQQLWHFTMYKVALVRDVGFLHLGNFNCCSCSQAIRVTIPNFMVIG